jgi:hypothetical protein
MTQTKEIRILKHFKSEMDKRSVNFMDELERAQYSREEYRKLCADSYSEVILFLAGHWKMKCREIKDAINEGKIQTNKRPRRYDSRINYTEPL